jgi:hypothetical protein
MNKKMLLKTLLPIVTVALLGGGIASSLTLTSCGKSKIIFRSEDDLNSYLSKHSSSGDEIEFAYGENGYLEDVNNYHSYLLPVYTRQNFINSMLFTYAHGSGARYPVTLDNNEIFVNHEDGMHVNVDIISFTSLDDFSYIVQQKDPYIITNMFSSAQYLPFASDYKIMLSYDLGERVVAFDNSPYDFSNITYYID